jgi:transcriptional regulator of PTS gene
MLGTVEETAFESAHQRDCARAYLLVGRGAAHSRSEIGRALGLRSTTTSRVVADLVRRRLLLETAGETVGRGRPAGGLLFNPQRIGGSVIQIASQSFAGSLVDLNGTTVAQRTVVVPRDAGNAVISQQLAALAAALVEDMPRGMIHAGTAVSLPGLLDLSKTRWMMASRWSRMHGLAIDEVLSDIGGPVEICRNLDADLRARLTHEPQIFGQGPLLLLHWGWGIGTAFAVDGRPFTSGVGSFGEIGHWRISALEGRPCTCGNDGCLETGAALWSLLPVLRRHWPDLADDESRLYEQLPDRDLMALPEIDLATRELARALANSWRVLFPARIVVTGPFVSNAALWSHFTTLFQSECAMAGIAAPLLYADRVSRNFELHGAAEPLLRRAVEQLLRSP